MALSSCLVHALPGRLRLRLPALRGDAALAARLVGRLHAQPGVRHAEANPVTGSLLVLFDPGQVSAGQISAVLGLQEAPAEPDLRQATRQATRLATRQATRQALLTGGALAFVAGKRLLLGPSALSRSWGSYDLAGIVTVAASYPLLRRGVDGVFHGRALSGEVGLGVAGLAATVLRENVLGLSVLFLTSLAHLLFARTLAECHDRVGPRPAGIRRPCHDRDLDRLSARTAARWGRWSVGAAAATGLLTGDWRRALAALVAAAPAAAALSASLPLCAATAAAARMGVFTRGADAVAAAGHVDAVVTSERREQVAALQARGRVVVAVGASAATLAAADLGVSVGAPAPAADAVIASSDGAGLALRRFLDLGRRAVATAHRNRALATLLNLAGLCLAVTGVMGPLTASLWHNATSLLVVVNALRLLPRRAYV